MLFKDWEDDIRFAAKEEGLKEGIEPGVKRGIEQGVEKGLEQGRNEGIRLLYAGLIRNGINEEDALNQVSEAYRKPVQEIKEVVHSAQNSEDSEEISFH